MSLNTFNIKYDQSRVRKHHYFMLLSLIQKNKRISRTQLAKLTKMSNTSVGKIVKELIDDGLVIEVGLTKGLVGRRATLLELNPNGSYIIGIEIDLDFVQLAIVSLNGEIRKKVYLEFDTKYHAEVVLDKIAEETIKMVNDVDVEISKKIIAVGVTLPGFISWPDGEVSLVPQFHWLNIPVKSYLEKKIDYVVYVDNDVKAVLL